jgi:regulator of sigma E protease
MTLILFLLILGITVFIHELGHFIFAKISGAYIFEFSIGMGPTIHKWKRKNDPTNYSLRLLPIGGFVSIAGEDSEVENIPKEQQLLYKPWINRFLTMIAGVTFNFLLAIILLFFVGLLNGVPKYQTKIEEVEETFPIYETNIQSGDTIIKYNGKSVKTQDKLSLLVSMNGDKEVTLTVKHENGQTEDVKVTPKKVEDTYKLGFTLNNEKTRDFISLITYPFKKLASLVSQMLDILKYLVLGKLSLSNLSGPLGIYQIVDEAKNEGLINILYLTAYLCINVGIINILPLPAFDGGRAFFLLIEKITNKKVNPKFENTIHTIGFYLLMLLMVLITYNDIIRLIK